MFLETQKKPYANPKMLALSHSQTVGFT